MFFILWKFKETFIKTSQKETFYKIVLNLSDQFSKEECIDYLFKYFLDLKKLTDLKTDHILLNLVIELINKIGPSTIQEVYESYFVSILKGNDQKLRKVILQFYSENCQNENS